MFCTSTAIPHCCSTFQAHGESPGRRITFGKLEGMDAAAAVRFVRGRLPGERIGVIGVSLGGAAAVLAPKPLPIAAAVLESVYPNIDAALSNRLRVNLGPGLGGLLTPLLTPVFEWLLPPILGVTPGVLRPADGIRTLHVPTPVASGVRRIVTLRSPRRAPCSIAPRNRKYSGRSRKRDTSTSSGMTRQSTGRQSCRSWTAT